ncbi:MAG: flagellar basal body P-ring formation protein FlgA [Bryobacterales bacterium]|nr:flagellar basal body P-ring formation protein FlgA [Bryobacterales bacterium]
MLPPEQPFGFPPQPGASRTIQPAELMRWARRQGVTLPAAAPVCVTVQTTTLDPAALEQAVRQALHAPPEAAVVIVDYSRWPIARGTLELIPNPSAFTHSENGQVIRGVVRYGNRLTQPIWVRVKVDLDQTVVVAREVLPAGKPIGESSLRVENVRGYPLPAEFPSKITDVAGLAPRKAISPGTRVSRLNLTAPLAIEKGQTVDVDVVSGAARIKFTATAQTSARQGDRIILENPTTHRRFTAKLTGDKRAELTINSQTKERK